MAGKSLTCILLSTVLAARVFCGGNNETPTIVVATDPTYPPMEFLNDSGEMVGFDIELMEAIARAEGFNVEFKSVFWDSIFAGLLDESYAAVISSVTITEARKKSFDFSAPYIKADQVLVAETAMESVKSIADLSGKSIGVLSGSAASASLYRLEDKYNIRVAAFHDQIDAVTEMLSGRLNAVALDLIYARILTHDREYKDKLRIVGQSLIKEDYGVVVKKGNTEVLGLINGGLIKVVASGELKELEQKWFDTK